MLINSKLEDFFPDWEDNGGIFSAMDSSLIPWASAVSADVLDVAYFGGHSGRKPPSPLVVRMSDGGDPLTTAARENLADIIATLNTPNFSRLWEILSAQYNPLTNYDMTETLSETNAVAYGKTQQRTDNLSHGHTGSETRTPNLTTTDTGSENTTRTPNLTETRTPNTTETQTNGIYGFNSASASNSDTSQKTETGTETRATTGTDTNAVTTGNTRTETGTETRGTTRTDTATGTVTTADSGRDTTTVTRTLIRSGNIGVTTSQQMLESERNLWVWKYFDDVVFPAVDRVLTLPIYG